MSDREQEADQDQLAEATARAKLCALEAVLFMAAEPLPEDELAEILGVTPSEFAALAQQLAGDYANRGLQLTRIAGGYQVSTRPEYGSFVAKLHKPERFRLSRAALETLAIVAYKQPATRPEIDAIRGVNSDSALDTLLQYELVCEVGRKDAPGRPLLYRTTEQFLGHFGLNSLEDLPVLDTIPSEQPESEAARPDSPTAERGSEPDTEPGPGESPDRSAE